VKNVTVCTSPHPSQCQMGALAMKMPIATVALIIVLSCLSVQGQRANTADPPVHWTGP
jgi:hypothetical protein